MAVVWHDCLQMSANAGVLAECEVKTLMILDLAFHVRSSWEGRAEIGRSSWKDPNTVPHMKAVILCPCNRLATLHGSLRTLLKMLLILLLLNVVIVALAYLLALRPCS